MNRDLPIEIAAASKTYRGGVAALKAASFAIQPGERACLLGPNGAGKTTLIRLLTGALSPTSGSARLFGAAAHEPGFLAAKRRVGIVPQSSGMYRDYTVREFLGLVRELYGAGDLAQVAAAFGLEPYLDRPMAQLSGGYQRRLAMAAAVLPQPELLLLDEPTAGLDPVAAREVHDYLREMMAGRTTLLCTHNLAEAEALCESVVILRDGQVLLHERLERLRERARPLLELAALEGPERLLAALERLGHPGERTDQLVRVPLPGGQPSAAALLSDLVGAGVQVYECHIVVPNLEELFLDVVGGEDEHA